MGFYTRFSIVAAFISICFSYNVQAQNALNFDGSNDYVQTSYSGVLGTANRTFEAWINVDSNASGNNAILDYGFNKVGSRNTFAVSGTEQLIFISGGTNANISSSANAVPLGKWAHVAFVLNSGTGYLYVNGKQVGTGSLSTVNTPSGNTNLRIGQRVPGGSIPFEGSIDEVRIWNVARSATEISNNMSAELCITDPNLVAYHKFNHGNAGKNNAKIDKSVDLSGNGNNGDLENFALSGATSNWITGHLSKGIVYGADTLTRCGKFESPSGKTFTSSGKYVDTLKGYVGCDSITTYNLTILTNPTKTINATSCKTYISPSGQMAWSTSGVYTDRLPNPNGCDTIVTVNLIVSNRSRDTAYIAHCGPYTSPSGKYVWDSSGQYEDTLASIYNCDSIITVYFTQEQSESSIAPMACDAYVSPSGKTWTQSGIYYDTIPNSKSCDSLITIDLTVNQTQYSAINEFSCTAYTTPSGRHVYSQSGVYTDTIPSGMGCDSIITITLDIGQKNASLNYTSCDAFVSPSGKTWNTSGAYTDTIKTTRGCDSILSIQLTVGKTGYGKGVLTGCNTVTSPSGRHIYNTSGTYTDTFFRQTLCDSIVELEVTIDALQKPEITRTNEQTIESSVSGDAYQWLDCEKGFDEIQGATSKSYAPLKTIEYAVEVTKGSCIDTSDCYLYLSAHNSEIENQINIYPNPATTFLHLEMAVSDELVEWRIIDINGRTRLISTSPNTKEIDISHLSTGLYTLELVTETAVAFKSFIKE